MGTRHRDRIDRHFIPKVTENLGWRVNCSDDEEVAEMEKRLVIVTLQFVLMTLGKLSVKNVSKNVKNTNI